MLIKIEIEEENAKEIIKELEIQMVGKPVRELLKILQDKLLNPPSSSVNTNICHRNCFADLDGKTCLICGHEIES